MPGLMIAVAGAVAGLLTNRIFDTLSPHVVAVIIGALLANTGRLRDVDRYGLQFAGRHLLRAGIVVLGFRLSIREVLDLGPRALLAVVCVVTATFFGTRWLGRRLGVGPGLAMLVGVGYSICGASAIAAAKPFSDANEEETAYAIGLVTLCGSLAILVLPPLGGLLGLSDGNFGSWVGASVHDVGQVVAAASTHGTDALKPAIIVKLTRVALLAPMLAGIAVSRRQGRSTAAQATERPPILPTFVVLFLLVVVVRSTGVVPAAALSDIKLVETLLLGAGLVGLGSGVSIRRLRQLGGRPLVLGLVSWMLVATVSLAAVLIAGA